MTVRVRSQRVTFIRPFILEGLEGVQPSGTYSVETSEELTGFFLLFSTKQRSTCIRVCQNHGIAGVLQMVNIDPLDLSAAQMRDAMPELSLEAEL